MSDISKHCKCFSLHNVEHTTVDKSGLFVMCSAGCGMYKPRLVCSCRKLATKDGQWVKCSSGCKDIRSSQDSFSVLRGDIWESFLLSKTFKSILDSKKPVLESKSECVICCDGMKSLYAVPKDIWLNSKVPKGYDSIEWVCIVCHKDIPVKTQDDLYRVRFYTMFGFG